MHSPTDKSKSRAERTRIAATQPDPATKNLFESEGPVYVSFDNENIFQSEEEQKSNAKVKNEVEEVIAANSTQRSSRKTRTVVFDEGHVDLE